MQYNISQIDKELGDCEDFINFQNIMIKARSYFYNLHDFGVNQKYDNIYNYSLHLKAVSKQLVVFKKLIMKTEKPGDLLYKFVNEHSLFAVLLIATDGHDSIEDARKTFNDIKAKMKEFGLPEYFAEMIAEIIYCVTDEKGRTRKERKNDNYYIELFQNILAMLIKLADIAANLIYSILMDHGSVFTKFKEFEYIYKNCPETYRENFSEIFKYIFQLFKSVDYEANVT